MYFEGLVAAAAAVAAFSAPAPAATATAGPLAAAPRPAAVNLRAEFAGLAGHVTRGPIAGVVPARGSRVTAAAARVTAARVTAARVTAAADPCTEPACPLMYNGGPVQHRPRVYLVLWGNWSSPAAVTAESYLVSMYQGLGVTPQDTWSASTTQYADTSGSPWLTGPVLAGYVNDTATPPNPVTENDLDTEAAAFVSHFGITDLTDAQVVVASAPGTCFSDGFAGNCGTPSASGGYCGWHSWVSTGTGRLPFTNLPFQLDAQYQCGENWINGGYSGEFDGFTTIGGHEYAESVTDPLINAWYDASDTVSGGEIADKCAWGGAAFGVTDPAGDVALSTGTFAMQSLWSNSSRGCVLTTAPRLTITTPAPEQSLLGQTASLQIAATTNDGRMLTYSARGLPPGLSIDRSAGVISGVLSTTAGTWHPVVVVTAGSLSKSVTFGWQVSSPPGAVRGSGKCADDSGGRTSGGTKIDLWSCTGKTPQRITFAADGQLRVVGRCVTASKIAFLEPCTGVANKTWTRLASGEYMVASSGLCLTAPAARNGVQLTLAACKNSSAQHWSLP